MEYDLAIIGAGDAGRAAAVLAAGRGAKVALVDRLPEPGGWTARVGIGIRVLEEAASFVERAAALSPHLQVSLKKNLSLADLLYRRSMVQDRFCAAAARELDRHHVHRIRGDASIGGPNLLNVEGYPPLIARRILICTGSRATDPAGRPADGPRIFTADSFLQMGRFPESLAIVGNDALAQRLGSIFGHLGVKHVDESIAQVVIHTASRRGETETLNLQQLNITPTATGHLTANPDTGQLTDSVYAAGDVVSPPAAR